MFHSLSFKIGLLFFVFILFIETLLFSVLYINLANDRIDEVMNSLLARGNTHRDVLEDHLDTSTIDHVRIMESESEYIVVMTDERGEVAASSDPTDEDMMTIIDHTDGSQVPDEGMIVEDRWNDKQYIASDSPVIVDSEYKGSVWMLADTDYVKSTVNQLNKQFLLAGMLTVLLTIVTIFILSRFIAQPLIKMKEATEQLSNGSHYVQLNTARKDELGELSRSIMRLSSDLKRLKTERKEFLSSISHEIRTPLTYINGYADIINRRDIPKEELKEYTGIIQEETEQLTELVKTLFQLAKMDHNTFAIEPERVRVCEFLENIAERMRPLLTEKNIVLHIHCRDDLVEWLDQERFQEVLMNVLDNARKYSDEGTHIQIHVEQTSQQTTMTVTDEGSGIPEEELPYIFDRLYRVDKSRSRQSGGSGLGLVIAKEIVEAHDGSIEVESKLGQGTSVMITLARRGRNG